MMVGCRQASKERNKKCKPKQVSFDTVGDDVSRSNYGTVTVTVSTSHRSASSAKPLPPRKRK